MNIVPQFMRNLFVREAAVLGWLWIPDDHRVTEELKPLAAEKNFAEREDYVVVRLAEMYLKTTRVLWKEFYPLVHSFVGYGDSAAPHSVATIAGPGQLKELGTDNLDRLIGLAYRLAGPLVYDGQDIELLAGLYAVPAKDGAKVLIDTLAQLSNIVPTLKQATDVANVVKGGVEGLLGIGGTRLTLGIHDVLRQVGTGVVRPARPGFIVAINAPAQSIKPERLWIRGGRLYEGPNPIAAQPFASYDMMLFEVHRGPSRALNWATLPQFAPHIAAFDALLKGEAALPELKTKLNRAFLAFETDLRVIEDLTNPDKASIRSLVSDDLRQRVLKIEGGGLFETRSVAGRGEEIELRRFIPRFIADPPAGVPLPSRAEGLPVFG